MSSHKKRPKTKRAKHKTDSLPDLDPIVDALWDAYAFVWTANQVIAQGNHGPEQFVMRQGVEAFERACEQLEAAHLELSRLRRATGGAS